MRLPSILSALAVIAVLGSVSCGKAPEDPLCQFTPLPASSGVPDGQGAVRISAPTDEYFYLADTRKNDIAHAHLGMAAAVRPGAYDVRLNGSHHLVQVRKNLLTGCAAGTLLARGTTDEYDYVSDSTGTEIAHQHLGSSLALFPGMYTVRVNNTTAPVSVAAGAPAELKTGVLLVRGTTDEYYYVSNSAGTEIAHQHLNSPLALFPGAYTAKINHAEIPAKVDADATSEYQTATLTVNGTADAYYYVRDHNGTELGRAHLNAALSLPGGSYSVKLGTETRPVELTASQASVVSW